MWIYCPIWITCLLSIVMAVVWTSYGNDNWSSGSVLANCLPYVMANCMSQIIHQTMGQSIPFAWQNVLFQISVWYLHCFSLLDLIIPKEHRFPSWYLSNTCVCVHHVSKWQNSGDTSIVDLSKSFYCIWIQMIRYLDWPFFKLRSVSRPATGFSKITNFQNNELR